MFHQPFLLWHINSHCATLETAFCLCHSDKGCMTQSVNIFCSSINWNNLFIAGVKSRYDTRFSYTQKWHIQCQLHKFGGSSNIQWPPREECMYLFFKMTPTLNLLRHLKLNDYGALCCHCVLWLCQLVVKHDFIVDRTKRHWFKWILSQKISWLKMQNS